MIANAIKDIYKQESVKVCEGMYSNGGGSILVPLK